MIDQIETVEWIPIYLNTHVFLLTQKDIILVDEVWSIGSLRFLILRISLYGTVQLYYRLLLFFQIKWYGTYVRSVRMFSRTLSRENSKIL